MAQIINVYVGIPENDKKVSVSTDTTVSQLLQDANVTVSGMIQHNGRTLSGAELNKSLESLGVVNNDGIYVVKKMDGAFSFA